MDWLRQRAVRRRQPGDRSPTRSALLADGLGHRGLEHGGAQANSRKAEAEWCGRGQAGYGVDADRSADAPPTRGSANQFVGHDVDASRLALGRSARTRGSSRRRSCPGAAQCAARSATLVAARGEVAVGSSTAPRRLELRQHLVLVLPHARPQVQPTGLALAALAGERDIRPKVRRSLELLLHMLSDRHDDRLALLCAHGACRLTAFGPKRPAVGCRRPTGERLRAAARRTTWRSWSWRRKKGNPVPHSNDCRDRVDRLQVQPSRHVRRRGRRDGGRVGLSACCGRFFRPSHPSFSPETSTTTVPLPRPSWRGWKRWASTRIGSAGGRCLLKPNLVEPRWPRRKSRPIRTSCSPRPKSFAAGAPKSRGRRPRPRPRHRDGLGRVGHGCGLKRREAAVCRPQLQRVRQCPTPAGAARCRLHVPGGRRRCRFDRLDAEAQDAPLDGFHRRP